MYALQEKHQLQIGSFKQELDTLHNTLVNVVREAIEKLHEYRIDHLEESLEGISLYLTFDRQILLALLFLNYD